MNQFLNSLPQNGLNIAPYQLTQSAPNLTHSHLSLKIFPGEKLQDPRFKGDQLILKKISKIVATRRHILTKKCTKIDFGCGSAPDPAGGAYNPPTDPLAVFKGPTS